MAAETRSVLIVDDDAQIRSLLADLLKENGYATQPAKTAAEATTQIAKQRPDLVMMDVKLPDQDGLDLLKAIKREHPELDIIVMTAFGGSSSAIKAMEVGAYDYVTKPLFPDEILVTIRKALSAPVVCAKGCDEGSSRGCTLACRPEPDRSHFATRRTTWP